MSEIEVWGKRASDIRRLCNDVIGFADCLERGSYDPVRQLEIEALFTARALTLATTIIQTMEGGGGDIAGAG